MNESPIQKSFFILPETLHLKELDRLNFVAAVLRFAITHRLHLDPRSRISEHQVYIVLSAYDSADDSEKERVQTSFLMLDSFTSGYLAGIGAADAKRIPEKKNGAAK